MDDEFVNDINIEFSGEQQPNWSEFENIKWVSTPYKFGKPFYLYQNKKGEIKTIHGWAWWINLRVFFLKHLFGAKVK